MERHQSEGNLSVPHSLSVIPASCSLDHLSIVAVVIVIILIRQHLIERVATWLHLTFSTSWCAWQTADSARATSSTASARAVALNCFKLIVWRGIHFIHYWDELILVCCKQTGLAMKWKTKGRFKHHTVILYRLRSTIGDSDFMME